MQSAEYISLYKLNDFIRQVIDINFDEWVKVKAEINQANESRGHYYLQLVEKDEGTDALIAKQSAVIWRNTALFLQRKYGSLFQDLIQDGNELVLSCKVEFHPKYGLKLVIQDIDADYTLGELEKKKRETLAYLEKHGLIRLNKSLPIPAAIQRVAIISSRTAAGYADFVDQISQNPYGHGYRIDLYHSAVQGPATVKEVTQNLREIYLRSDKYDVVCILRGGGSKIDLAGFDELEIAKCISEAPLPVITGIGHEVDTSIADVVAHTSVKTPTAIANFILHHNESFLDTVWNLAYQIVQSGRSIMERQGKTLQDVAYRMHTTSSRYFAKELNQLELYRQKLQFRTASWIEQLKRQVEEQGLKLTHLRPDNILKRGYSITLKGNKVLTKASQAEDGEHIETILYKGSLDSVIKSIKDE